MTAQTRTGAVIFARNLEKRDGALKATEQEREMRGLRACGGHDPEGNVFQLRQPLP